MNDFEKALEKLVEHISSGISYQQSLQKIYHEFQLTPIDLKLIKKLYKERTEK
ncbi:MAG: hypothetical protein AAFX80_07960 [Cyanobacteria bacterium J06639_18]